MRFNLNKDFNALWTYFPLLLLFPFILSAFEPRPVTPYPVVGLREISFEDDFQKLNRRLLIWYPVEAQIVGTPSTNPWDLFHVAINAVPTQGQVKKPLIVLSHGYLGNPHHLSWLIRGLVYHGFIVIGIRHTDLMEGKFHMNHWQRARDVKTMLDQFFASSMAEFANPQQVGIAGYSLGGTTAIWVAGGRINKLDSLVPGPEYAASHEFSRVNEALPTLNKEMMSKDWREPRIKAAFVMAPAWSWVFDENSLEHISIPTYLIATEADQIVVTKNNSGFFARHIPHASYQTIPGKAGHYIFIAALNERQRKLADPSGQFDFLLQDDVTVDREWIQFQVAEEAWRFFHSVFEGSNTP